MYTLRTRALHLKMDFELNCQSPLETKVKRIEAKDLLPLALAFANSNADIM